MLSQATQKKKNRIKDLPEDDRPREKLLHKGQENLSDAELIALLLGTGTKKQNAITLAQQLLRQFPLQKIATISMEGLTKTPGIGKGKAARIIAALELGERIFAPVSITKIIIHSQEAIISECKEIANKKQEHLLALYLNARHELIQKEIIALGNVNAIRIEPKEIFTPAVLSPCTEIILAHNHPSGNPAPSDDDVRFTKRVQDAGAIMGIPLLDHLIIGKTGYFSFRNNKIY